MPHGSVVEVDGEGARRWLAPDGAEVAAIAPDGVTLHLTGVHERPVTVGGPVEEHPVLGAVQVIRALPRGARDDEPGTVVARVTTTNWSRPGQIPAIDAPARVPAGAGSVLLNVLAIGAQVAGQTLRYAGPYPTAALWSSLRDSFRTEATEEMFTDGALERALRGDISEVPVDFTPAPFERVLVAPRAVVHLRDGVERLYLGGLAWAPGAPARRLVRDGDQLRATLWIGGSEWAEVATLDAGGQLLAGPRALPAVRSAVLGKGFPPALLEALIELMAEDEPPMLATAMREVVRDTPVVWGDPGADAARPIAGVLVVHAGIWERLGGGSAASLAAHLAAALTPPVKQLAQLRLETVPIGVALH